METIETETILNELNSLANDVNDIKTKIACINSGIMQLNRQLYKCLPELHNNHNYGPTYTEAELDAQDAKELEDAKNTASDEWILLNKGNDIYGNT